MYASFGDGDKALSSMEEYLDSPNLHPNTMYTEGFPVLESGLVGATALQDMLLQSWGGKIRIFPGIPSHWKNAVFHDLRAEGAFLVSAGHQDGTTRWARIKSLAGGPCRVAGIVGADFAFVSTQPDASCRKLDSGDLEITIPRGGEAFLFNGPVLTSPQIQPLAADTGSSNPYGRKMPRRDPANFEIDDDDPECILSGEWQTSNIAARGTSATRYISVKNEGAAEWRPRIQQTGKYRVLFFKVAHQSNARDAIVEVAFSGGEHKTLEMDLASGDSGWVDLGIFPFDQGTIGSVRLSKGSNGLLRADAVRFELQQ
jgi:hypothetical protein